MANKIRVSSLPKTWILDIDGTIVKHNGYKLDGQDSLLDNVKSFFNTINENDLIVIVTSRKEEYKKETEEFLHKNGIRFNTIIYNAPYGERILINDRKPSGLDMAIAVNIERDSFADFLFEIDESL